MTFLFEVVDIRIDFESVHGFTGKFVCGGRIAKSRICHTTWWLDQLGTLLISTIGY